MRLVVRGPVCDRRGPALIALVAAVAACSPSRQTGSAPRPSTAVDADVRRAIASEARLDPSSFPARSLGITPFRVDPRDSTIAPLGFGLADLLITDLSRSRRLTVVDRMRVDALLRELRLVSSGRVDSIGAPRAGRILGARQLVLGSLHSTPRGDIAIDAVIAGTQTGRVEGSVSGAAPLDRILDAEKAVALALFDRLSITLTPAERAAVEQRPTRNITALLAYSRGVRDEATGDLGGASRNYATATRLDPGFLLARSRLADVDARLRGASTTRLARTETRETRPSGGLDRATALATDGINRGLPLQIPDAADPSFRTVQQLITLVIVVNIP